MTLFQELLVIEASKPRFARTYCSQCGGEFGPGDEGFSHCADHSSLAAWWKQHEDKLLPELEQICVDAIHDADVYWEDYEDLGEVDLSDEEEAACDEVERRLMQAHGSADADAAQALAIKIWRDALEKCWDSAHEGGSADKG